MKEIDVSALTFDRLRFLMSPFGYTFETRQWDGGQTIRCMTPGRCLITASADWGEATTAPGRMMDTLLRNGLVPAPIVELLEKTT